MPGPRRAFTLIELLVVIAVIALLISMLLPAIAQARESGRNVVCMSNNRQLGTAMAVYLGENKGYFPGDHWESGGGQSVVTWTVRLRKLIQTEHTFDCPTRPSDYRWVPQYNVAGMMQQYAWYVGWRENEDVYHAWKLMPRCYGYNGWGYNEFVNTNGQNFGLGGHIKHPREFMADTKQGLNTGDRPYWEPNENKAVQPTDLIVLADSNGDRSWDHSIGPVTNRPGRTHFVNRNNPTSGKCNVLFLDTHVGGSSPIDVFYAASETIEQKRIKMQRWNIDHKPHGEQWQ